MYLLTTGRGRCGTDRGRARRASTSAAIVLPVPLSPANSALMPRPRALCAAKPQSLVDRRAVPHVARDLPQRLQLRVRQHEVVPAGAGVDALREVVERAGTRARGSGGAARRPDRPPRCAAALATWRTSCALRRKPAPASASAVAASTAVAQHALPQLALVAAIGRRRRWRRSPRSTAIGSRSATSTSRRSCSTKRRAPCGGASASPARRAARRRTARPRAPRAWRAPRRSCAAAGMSAAAIA